MANVAHSTLTGANLHEPKGVASASAGEVYVADGASSGSWSSVQPIGIIAPYGGSSAPSAWLLCYGQAISRTTYADLYAVLGTTYGSGDGSTTFNLPDLRGRVVAGQDDMGGTSADRLTGSITGSVNGDTLGGTGGEEGHSLIEAENGPHTHTQYLRAVSGTGAAAGGLNIASSNLTSMVNVSSGSGDAHNTVQPTIILNYIVYTGV